MTGKPTSFTPAMRWLALAVTLAVTLALPLALPLAAQPGPEARPHLLVADTGNHRILELDGAGALAWSFGDGSWQPGPHSVVGPVDALRVDATYFVCGAGVPPGGSPQCPGGCVDNRVLGRVGKQEGPAMMAPAMAGQGTRGGRIGNTDDERNAGRPWPMPSPGGRRPEAQLSCASPLKVSPILPAGLALDTRASGRRRGALLFADTP